MSKPAFKLVEDETPPISSQASSAVDMKYLIKALLKYNASDLHIKVGRPPLYRINGKLIPAKIPELNAEQVEALLYSVLSQKQIMMLDQRRHVDFSFCIRDLGRFRCNAYFQRSNLSAAIRMIPFTVPSLDELGVPPVLKDLSQRARGLVLITGSTGSGKSTTLAAMIQHINENNNVHILTLEDPIEFVHRDLKASITQREVGSDVESLRDGLYAGLRQDPDVIMIGELRDSEMIQTALTAAETGHLVLATLHTNDTKSSIDRILDSVPAESLNQVRIQLASTLVGIVSQQLVITTDGSGRVPACEVLVKSPTIENYLLKDERERIPEAIASSSNHYKMQTMNQSLEKLVNAGKISAEEALKASPNPADLRLILSGVAREQGYEIMNHPYKK